MNTRVLISSTIALSVLAVGAALLATNPLTAVSSPLPSAPQPALHQAELVSALAADLSAPGITASAAADGVHLASHAGAPALSLALTSCGRADAVMQLPAIEPQRAPGFVEYRYTDAISAWYVGDARGIDQGFSIDQRPAGAGELVLTVAATGSGLRAEDFASDMVAWRDGAGKVRWACDALAAFDRDGSSLPARMRAVTGGIEIRVDDAAAAYPITIDPTYTEVSGASLRISVAAIGFVPGGFSYRFACDNFTATTIAAPLGPDNRFSTLPLGSVKTPPTTFAPGRTLSADGVIDPRTVQTWTLRHADGVQTATADPNRREISPILENGGYTLIDPARPDERIAEWGYLNRLPYPAFLERRSERNRLTRESALTISGWPQRFVPGRQRAVMRTTWRAADAANVAWTLWGRTATAGAGRSQPLPGANQPPMVALVGTPATYASIATDIALAVSDPDGDSTTVTVVSAPDQGGSVDVVAPGMLRYVPRDGFIGEERFAVRAQDARGGLSGSLTITVPVRLIGDGAVQLLSYRDDTGQTGEGESEVLGISDDGRLVLLASEVALDGIAAGCFVRDRITGTLRRMSGLSDYPAPVISGDGSMALGFGSDGSFCAIATATGEVIRSDSVPVDFSYYVRVGANTDGSVVAIYAQYPPVLYRWTLADGLADEQPLSGGYAIASPRLSADGRRIVMVENSGLIEPLPGEDLPQEVEHMTVWDVGTPARTITSIGAGFSLNFWCEFDLDASGQHVVMDIFDAQVNSGGIGLFDVDSGVMSRVWLFDNAGTSRLALSRDGAWIGWGQWAEVPPGMPAWVDDVEALARLNTADGSIEWLGSVAGSFFYSPTYRFARGAPAIAVADRRPLSPDDTNTDQPTEDNQTGVFDAYALGTTGWQAPPPATGN